MAKFHPIDVRYKGPSTAYQGKSKVPLAPKGPWTSPAPAAPTPKRTQKPKRGVLHWIIAIISAPFVHLSYLMAAVGLYFLLFHFDTLLGLSSFFLGNGMNSLNTNSF